MRRLMAAIALAGVAMIASCGRESAQQLAAPVPNEPRIRVEQLIVTPTPGGRDMSAGYMTIYNDGAQPDVLLSASSPSAARVDIHETRIGQGGAMQMFPIAGGVTIPSQGSVSFAPAGLHLMVDGLRAPLAEGERTQITLTFQRTGSVTYEAIVARPVAGGAAPGADMDMSGHQH
ncbi:MAG: copper chaperone PCu(A)C [Caulobacterales bacterium]